MINRISLISSLLLVAVFTSCKSTKESSTQPKTSILKAKENHSAHWYIQQSIARQLKEMPEDELEKFLEMYFPTNDELQKLDSLVTK